MKHFLVTGGAGFIGAHAVQGLLDAGHAVTVLDNFSSGEKARVAGHRHLLWIERDLLWTGAEEIPDRLDGILHLAGWVADARWGRDALPAHHANLSATVRVLTLAHEKAVDRVVFSSSALLDLLDPPIIPYVVQKRAAEAYGAVFGEGFRAVRLPWVTGPGMRDWAVYREYQEAIGAETVASAVDRLIGALLSVP